jgi:hypothetical protein
MAVDDQKTLLRALLKRGFTPLSAKEAIEQAVAKTARRFPRGNITMQKNPPLTRKGVEEMRDRRREKLRAREHA